MAEIILFVLLPVLLVVICGGAFAAGRYSADRSNAKAALKKGDIEKMHDELTQLRLFLHDAEELAWQNKGFEPLGSEAILQLARKTRNHKALNA